MKRDEIELRAEGLLVHDHRLLLVEHARDGQAYWVFPGGHVEPGETLADATTREFQEELSLKVSVKRLLWIHQFIRPPRHTVNFSFLLTCDDVETLRLDRGDRLTGFRWVAPEELDALDLRPPLQTLCRQVCLGNLPADVQVYRF